MNPGAVKGTIFNIQKFSTEDGPGIRTTVFLKGCPLRCPWCHNPESIKARPQLVWHGSRCIGDLACIEGCPEKALVSEEEGIRIDRHKCQDCGTCAEICPTGALEVLGSETTADEVMGEILKDRLFYEKSGGGVTFSGGEPTMQKEFLLELLQESHNAGLHTALDTCGHTRREVYEELVPFINLVLYDLKSLDEDFLREAAGASKELIVGNLKFLDSLGIPIWIRTPVVPGYTSSPGNILTIARFIKESLHNVKRFDLLSFSNLCISKYDELEMEYKLKAIPLLCKDEMSELEAIASAEGVEHVVVSGPVRE